MAVWICFAAAGKGQATSLVQVFGEQEAIRAIVESGTLAGLRWPNFSSQREEVEKFYRAAAYSAVWSKNSSPTPQARALIRAFQNAEEKGLSPDDYDDRLWDRRIESFDPASFDVATTVNAMRYISDLHLGRTKPQFLHNALDIDHKEYTASEILQRIASSPDVERDLESVEPQFSLYRRTADALHAYLRLSRVEDGPPLSPIAKPVKPGDRYEAVGQLAERLKLLGDLQSDAEVLVEPNVYAGALAEAVKHFQLRHGLDPDGVVGKETLAALNVPLARRVTQLRLALERWRWLPHEFAEPSVIVNIPEFRLHAYNAGFDEALSMKVVVGKAYKHQTPVFTTLLRQILFRPYWNVPYSIQRAELVPDIKRDPNYIAKNDYEVVTHGGKILSTGPIDAAMIEQLRTGKVAIRQRPGPKNALGLIKFVLPNQYDVYLHDTPAAVLFSKARRDFSHGCIRVEKPIELAEWLLKDQPEWTAERIQAAMHGDETLPVQVRTPLSVLVLYTTAMVTETGEVRFFEDIYSRDAPLEEAMIAGNRD